MKKLITRTQAIVIAHFAQPTPQAGALISAMDGRGYSASVKSLMSGGYLASTDTFPFRAATESGKAALIEYMTTPGMSLR